MKKSPRQTLTAPVRRSRFILMAGLFCFWVAAIAGKLAWLQIGRHKEFVERAARQQQKPVDLAPRRGLLYDRNLRELATTVLADSVFAVPSEIGENRGEAAAMLAKIVHKDNLDRFTTEPQILARLNGSKNFAWVAHKLDPESANRVRELNLKGIYFQKEFKRVYPNNDLAAQVLGFVGAEDKGLGGLELKYEDDMHGIAGKMMMQVDAKRHQLGTSEEEQSLPGENLVLSIDANIQYMAERALDAQMLKMKANHGTVVVMDPHTGQILALAISPRFNPNDSRHLDAESLIDLAVSNVYEPGSTFKLLTYAAAIDGAGVQPTDIVDCEGGAMTMYGRTLHDDKGDHFGRVTVQYALEHSSDVGAAKMALKLGNQKFYDYIRGFGFGDRSNIELPSETRGLLRTPRKWEATSILSIAIGHEVGVTPVQLVSMVSAIANGGVYMPPHILLQSTDAMKGDARLTPEAFHPMNQLPAVLPAGAHRVIKELTAAKMRSMMLGVVVEGTGKTAALNGYSAGGKTGTAQKIDPVTRTYSHTHTVASFAGMAPASNPAIAVAVVIDDPTVGTRYGAETSAPVFREVTQQVLEYLGVPHDQPLKTAKELVAARTMAPEADAPSENPGDLNAMFEEINSLPADDPLRQPANAAAMAANTVADKAEEEAEIRRAQMASQRQPTGAMRLLPAKVLAAFHANGNTTSVMPDTVSAASPLEARTPLEPKDPVPKERRSTGAVVVDSGKRVAVPEFRGNGLRSVVQEAGAAGLRVQPVGSGLAREQYPAPGTMVPAGTAIAVRFAR